MTASTPGDFNTGKEWVLFGAWWVKQKGSNFCILSSVAAWNLPPLPKAFRAGFYRITVEFIAQAQPETILSVSPWATMLSYREEWELKLSGLLAALTFEWIAREMFGKTWNPPPRADITFFLWILYRTWSSLPKCSQINRRLRGTRWLSCGSPTARSGFDVLLKDTIMAGELDGFCQFEREVMFLI